tara:strand:- start:49 stop:315 length:267 start_codon:yes stop_codon:yes gene_type:complete
MKAKYLEDGSVQAPSGACGDVKDLIRLGYMKETDVIESYVEPVPSTTDKILELEAEVTPRRSREAMLTGDYSFIQNIEEQIKALNVRK